MKSRERSSGHPQASRIVTLPLTAAALCITANLAAMFQTGQTVGPPIAAHVGFPPEADITGQRTGSSKSARNGRTHCNKQRL